MLIGTAAIAAQGHDQTRAKSKARVTKPTAVATTRGGSARAVQARERFATSRNSAVITTRNRERFTTGGNSATIETRNRVVTRSSYPYRTYGYRSYSYGYPYYGYGYYPYSGLSFGYYPYDYGYPYDYSYGYYYSHPAYGTHANSSVVTQVQARLARAGYYHGAIDGAMGPRTRYAIERYERDHGLRIDGAISRPLLRSMGLRY